MSPPIDLTPHEKKTTPVSLTGKILVTATGGIALGLTVVCASFVSPAFRKFCLPYVPATKTQVENIFVALRQQKGSLLDIGSGDGRIVLEASRYGFVAHGVELNFWLVLYSKLNALCSRQKVKFFHKDLWKFHIGNYNNIVIFGVEQMMSELEKKFYKECKNGCTVVACRFPLPNKLPSRTYGNGIDTVWVYNFTQ